MGKVKNILQAKGNHVYHVVPDVTVLHALEIMRDKNVGGVLVMSDEKLLGIFTERDYARKVALRGKSSKEVLIKEVMTPEPFTVTLESTIEQCMQLMSEKKIRHLPIVENGVLAGLISIGDVVRFIIEEQRNIIEQLEQYITGHH